MKKLISVFLCALLLLSLVGCGCEHEWNDATCTTPSTCALCEKTEGEALGHDWQDATCAAAKTCAHCGETEGEALPHASLSEANYQQGPICADCGAEVGEPLEASFEKHSLVCDVKIGETVHFEEYYSNDKEVCGPADFTVTGVERLTEHDVLPLEEGYELYRISVKLSVYGSGFRRHSVSMHSCHEDYYNIELHDDTSLYDEESGMDTYTISWMGEEKPIYELRAYNWSKWDGEGYHLDYTNTISIPEGYDGLVLGVQPGLVDWDDDDYVYDAMEKGAEYRFFRLTNDVKS